MYSCIVVGTDGSDTAAEAVRQAAELARIHGARLHLVSAYSPTLRAKLQAERELLPEEERWMASPGEQAERVLTEAAKGAEAQSANSAAPSHGCGLQNEAAPSAMHSRLVGAAPRRKAPSS